MKPKANSHLKHERELRGWSQAKLAEELGIDPTTVGRWERGLSLPYPHFRERLCTLFGKTVYELGLLEDGTNEQHNQTKIHHSSPPSAFYDLAIPLQLVGSTGVVGRETLTSQLKQQLCAEEGIPFIALNGLPGVGKTTLATHLAHDDDVRACFHDGILWARLGPKPQVAAQLSRWGALLGIDADTLKQKNGNAALVTCVHAAIGMRRMLLIIDDAWTLEDAFAFKIGGPNCACLLTTRFPPIALAFAPQGATVVRELNEKESISLLSHLAPEITTSEAHTLPMLVHSVGGLPLALTLMGSYLRMETYNGQSRRLHTALSRLRDEKARLQLSRPHGVLDLHTSLAHDTPLSLQSVIAISDQHLSEQAQSALRALSVLPAKPISFSEETALAISACAVEALDELCDAGLLECNDAHRYTLHQTIADYAHTYLHDRTAYQRFVAYFVQYVVSHEKDYRALGLEAGNILTALDVAYEQEMRKEFVQGVTIFSAFLCMRGLYALAEGRLQRAHQVATSLNDATGIILSSLYLGEIAEKRGDYTQAEMYFQEGLTLARLEKQQKHIALLLAKVGNVAYLRGDNAQLEEYIREGLALESQSGEVSQMSLFLVALGAAAVRCGNVAQADAYFQKGLELARQNEHKEQICLLLLHMGAMEEHRGDFVQAETILKDGLVLARQIEHYEHIVVLLTLLGITVEHREDYAQADMYYEEGLTLARQIAHPMRIGILLTHLGRRAGERGEYAKAHAYYQEALALAHKLVHPSLKIVVLNHWGETYLRHQHVEAAAIAFHEALAMTSEGQQEFYARTYYGLAHVAVAQDNLDEAKTYGEASVRAFEAIGHHKALKVRTWLDMLPNAFS